MIIKKKFYLGEVKKNQEKDEGKPNKEYSELHEKLNSSLSPEETKKMENSNIEDKDNLPDIPPTKNSKLDDDKRENVVGDLKDILRMK
ncbi:MAG: hypothetical protein V1872_12670 [bacterium]